MQAVHVQDAPDAIGPYCHIAITFRPGDLVIWVLDLKKLKMRRISIIFARISKK